MTNGAQRRVALSSRFGHFIIHFNACNLRVRLKWGGAGRSKIIMSGYSYWLAVACALCASCAPFVLCLVHHEDAHGGDWAVTCEGSSSHALSSLNAGLWPSALSTTKVLDACTSNIFYRMF